MGKWCFPWPGQIATEWSSKPPVGKIPPFFRGHTVGSPSHPSWQPLEHRSMESPVIAPGSSTSAEPKTWRAARDGMWRGRIAPWSDGCPIRVGLQRSSGDFRILPRKTLQVLGGPLGAIIGTLAQLVLVIPSIFAIELEQIHFWWVALQHVYFSSYLRFWSRFIR